MLELGRPFSIRICSRKGGEGKTQVAVNLAIALGTLGYKVLLVDVDPHSRGVADTIGLHNIKVSFSDIRVKGLNLQSGIVHYGEGKIDIIPQSFGLYRYHPTKAQVDRIELQILKLNYDFRISDSSSEFLVEPAIRYYTEFLDVVEPMTDSIESEVASIKRYRELGVAYRVLLNNVGRFKHAELSERMVETLLSITPVGIVPYDEKVIRASNIAKPVYLAYPKSKFSNAIRKLAKTYIRLSGFRK